MSTGPSSDSAEAPPEPEPPFTGGRRHSWLASHGRHPVTWAVAVVVLLGSAGVALLQQQPGGRGRTESVYCGLVKCAVLRSVADSSTATVAVPRPSPALPSPKAPSSAPASTPTPGDASATPGAIEAPEAGCCPQAGTHPFAQAARDANAESVADVGARAPALAVAAHLGVAVGRRRRSARPAIKRLLAARWPPPAGRVRLFRSMPACGAAEASTASRCGDSLRGSLGFRMIRGCSPRADAMVA